MSSAMSLVSASASCSSSPSVVSDSSRLGCIADRPAAVEEDEVGECRAESAEDIGADVTGRPAEEETYAAVDDVLAEEPFNVDGDRAATPLRGIALLPLSDSAAYAECPFCCCTIAVYACEALAMMHER
jgi:hypothetical protein